MEIRPRHWMIAVSTAALAHLGVVAGMREEPRSPPPTPVVIQLGDSGAPAAASAAEPTAAESIADSAAPLAPAKSLPMLAPSETLKTEVVEPPKPKPTPKPKPKAKPKPKPKAKPAPTRTERPKPRSRPSASDGPKSKTPGSSRGSGAHSNGKAGSGRGQGSGSGSKGTANYYGKLAAWLNRHKRYPSRARRLRQEGTVRVTFTIDRSGRVLSHRIASSSGHALLDQEVKALIRRASPLPAIPPGMSQSQLTVTVPIRFNLR
ncbi:energy transducer TonB family protein [Imhoffiella purpurea]|uniref:Protein TonB n=1 Tax=Imhoffiella purpurea TaxID=1249627 RepID=W9VDT0_9GAMM|nr:energy transducer TonB [Imhoffiella purpurea]EXJ14202.1 Ferric siderophore transport system, periplasmic binding protein TonB [Imhoffiella purpurea]